MATETQQIVNRDGQIVLPDGRHNSALAAYLHNCRDHKLAWGDHYRTIPKKIDHPSVVMKCKTCGRKLVDTAKL